MAKHLAEIFDHFGEPNIIQSDQGSKFKKHVSELCRKKGIKRICSRPYHPQSQGKVERLHSQLRKKINYEKIQKEKQGKPFNWMKFIKQYEKALNNDPMRALGNETPLDVYFGHSKNDLRKKARGATERASEDMLKRQQSKFKKYNRSDQVLVKFQRKQNRTLYV